MNQFLDDNSPERGLILQTFLAESLDGLNEMERSLLSLESNPDDAGPLSIAFRVAHTIKGNAASLGYPPVTRVAHALEDRLEQLRQKTPRPIISLLLEAVDALRAQMGQLAEGHEPAGYEGLIARLSDGAATTAPQQRAAESPAQLARTLRVDVDKLDRMLDLSGEVAIARGRLRALCLEGPPALREVADDLDQHCRALQDQILRARALPIGPFLMLQARTVRDAAASLGKKAVVRVEADGVDVDNSVLEALRDPLMHLVRNAVAHGIEAPAARKARGKDPVGTVLLRAHQEPGCVVVEIRDDGHGFDRDRIAARAKELGMPAAPAGDQLFEVVFQPGFSTAAAVDELSGRGIGMDVVRHNVEKLRGTVSIESVAGAGATVTLRLPVTLAVLDAFFVESAGKIWALPLDVVSECLDVSALAPGHTGLLPLRGQAVPWLRLSRQFGLPGDSTREGMVVVQHGGQRAGLVVDRFNGEGQAVLKPLGPALRGARGVTGGALLGNGAVALILDVPALLSAAIAATREANP